MTKGGSIFFLGQWGVNIVSCRREDSDFTLQEGGNGTLPPPMPTYASTTALKAAQSGPRIPNYVGQLRIWFQAVRTRWERRIRRVFLVLSPSSSSAPDFYGPSLLPRFANGASFLKESLLSAFFGVQQTAFQRATQGDLKIGID